MSTFLILASPDAAAAVGSFLAAHNPCSVASGAWLIKLEGDPHALNKMLTEFAGPNGDIVMLEVTGQIWGRGQLGLAAVQWMATQAG